MPLPPIFALSIAAAGYLLLTLRARRRNPVQGWGRWRTASFLAGIALTAAALLPPIDSFADEDFRGHMLQHMLIGMYAPLALVLGAPVTLLLRTLPTARARQLSGVLHSRAAKTLTHPVTALLLASGGLAVVYFTPVYEAAAGSGRHPLLHVHFLLSGCLFAYAIAGPDPAPARPGVRMRLFILGIAIAAHATIAQLLYAGFYVHIDAPVTEVQGGAEIMYYGGDIAELLLAAALVATWRPGVRARRRAARPAPFAAEPAQRVAGTGSRSG